jgi:hypothetical protein
MAGQGKRLGAWSFCRGLHVMSLREGCFCVCSRAAGSAWWEHTVQSFFQAISLAIFIVCSMIILWYLSQTRLFQQGARETGLLHGAVSWVKVLRPPPPPFLLIQSVCHISLLPHRNAACPVGHAGGTLPPCAPSFFPQRTIHQRRRRCLT